jgi:maltose alpha-D-glucosyltransferase/alpha-amylase
VGRGAPGAWYKDAVIYEVPVRAFADSNGDGIGDFPGLTSRLDYLQDLGITAVWLLPFSPSPGRDDGYDITDYREIDPAVGTLADFRAFLEAAHGRGIRVITELVLNHTSDRHPWFERARRAPRGSVERDFYVWSDDPSALGEARIIFRDAESSNWAWDPVSEAWYWHRFYRHQPDLNFRTPEVRRAIFDVVDFWLGMGVDGLRLDAVPFLFERDGTTCESLPETHGFLRDLRTFAEARYSGTCLLAEANQRPADAAAYFGEGDEAHMAFHFPLMPRLFLSAALEERGPLVDVLSETPPIPDACQWAVFLRNHDELSLEMVSQEERDLMYRAYAADPRARLNEGIRRRLAALMEARRPRIELLHGLLLSLAGSPVLYYGDEIGMGDDLMLNDRLGIRTPMQWSAGRGAGFTAAQEARLQPPVIRENGFGPHAVNVEDQASDPFSLLNAVRRLIAIRRRHPVFGRGSLDLLDVGNEHVVAFVRRSSEEHVLVAANLSSSSQDVVLDVPGGGGVVARDLLGGTTVPVGPGSSLRLGPSTLAWLSLDAVSLNGNGAGRSAPVLEGAG